MLNNVSKLNKRLMICTFLVVVLVLFLNTNKKNTVAFKDNNKIISKVVIDPGHGGIDGGASTKSGLLEKDINLDIALKIKQNLEINNINVIMTRQEDISLERNNSLGESRYKKDLYARKDIINKSDANAFVSVHVNSNAVDSNCKGVTIYYNPIYYESKKLSEDIAKSIDKYIYKDLFKNKYVKTKLIGENYYVLRETYIPGILIEVGFITNSFDKKMLEDKEYKKIIGSAISKGIIQYVDKLDDDSKTGILGF